MFARRSFCVARFLSILSSLVVVLACAAPALAVLLVNDRWKDTNRNDPASPTYADNNGVSVVDADGDGETESAWFYGGSSSNATLTVVAPGGGAAVPGSPNNLRFDFLVTGGSAAMMTYITPAATPVTLTNVGDKLSTTWVFTPRTVSTNANQSFRVGLMNWPESGTNSAARIITNNSSGDFVAGTIAYAGYAMFINLSTAPTNANPYNLMERGVDGNMLNTSGNWTSRNSPQYSDTSKGFVSDVEYTFTFNVELTNPGEVTVTSTMSGGTGSQALNGTGSISASFVDTSPNSLTYDMFAFRPSQAAQTADIFDTSLFQVDFTAAAIPEVSSFLLVGLVGSGTLAVSRFRRRRQVG